MKFHTSCMCLESVHCGLSINSSVCSLLAFIHSCPQLRDGSSWKHGATSDMYMPRKVSCMVPLHHLALSDEEFFWGSQQESRFTLQ